MNPYLPKMFACLAMVIACNIAVWLVHGPFKLIALAIQILFFVGIVVFGVLSVRWSRGYREPVA